MDWLQFIASVVGSLAWPSSMVLIVLLLRRAILRILPRLKRLKYGEAEFEFEEKLEEAEEEIAELPTPNSLSQTVQRTEQQFRAAGDFSNNSAVFIAWLTVESAVLNVARRGNLLQPNMSVLQAADLLLDNRVIDQGTYLAIRDLRHLRNIAVHPGEARQITDDEVSRFKALAEKIAAALADRLQSMA